MNSQYYRIHQDRYRYLLKKIKSLNLPPAAAILDIGCFPPHLFDALAHQGYRLYGIASPHEPVRRRHVHLLNVETDKLPFSPHQFDLVILSEVIEHLPNYPLPLLIKIRPLLKKNGLLMITTPNVSRLYNIILLILGRNIYFSLDQMSHTTTRNATIYHRHNREYSLLELHGLLSQAGYEVTTGETFTAYTPWRPSSSNSYLFLIARWLVYFYTCINGRFRDSLYLLSRPSTS